MRALPRLAARPGDARFGQRQTMRCLWFRNFEDRRFERYTVGGRKITADGGIPIFAAGAAKRFDREASEGVESVPWNVPGRDHRPFWASRDADTHAPWAMRVRI